MNKLTMFKPFTRKQRRWLALIIALYVLLGIHYALATPPLESSDEYKHYPVVQYIQTRGRLPVLDPADPGKWLQEGAQPPLYYALMALLTSGIDTGDLDEIHVVNPHVFLGDVAQIGNKNIIIHQPAREAFPWQGAILAIYLIRFASIGLGIGTLLTIAVLGQRLYTPGVGVLAAALTAFNPMFLFISAAVNNDSLAALMGHLGLLFLIGLWRTVPDPRRAWRHYVLFGFFLGLSMLTKLSLGGLLLLAGIALAVKAWQEGRPLLFWIGGPLIVAPVLFTTGWWFWRNWTLYGDLTGLNVFVAVQGVRDTAITLAGWIDEFGTFYRTYWGLFGGVSIAAPNLFYTLSNLLLAAGLIGFLWSLIRDRSSRHPRAVWLPAGWMAILFGLLLRWNLIYTSFQGRLIFPALGAINIFWVVGLLALWRWSNGRRAVAVLAAAYALVALLIPPLFIRPAYRLPHPIAAVPAEAEAGPYRFEAEAGTIQLVGLEMEPGQTAVRGEREPIAVTLYWQAVTPIKRDFITSVHLLGRNSQSVGQINRYPAAGMIPPSRWQPGEIYQDRYHIYVQDETAPAPARLRLSVSLYDPEADAPVPGVNADNQTLDPLLVGPPARLIPAAWPDPAGPPLATLGEGIHLTRATLDQATAAPGGTITIDVQWQVTAAPNRFLTTLIHLAHPGEPPLATGDSPPLAGNYPTTVWRAGDVIEDQYTLTIPAAAPDGRYPVWVGMYDPETLNRLPLTVAGEPQAAGIYQIGWLEVSR